jgi:hypothetical protein
MSKQPLKAELKALLQLSKPKIALEEFERTLKSISPSFDWHFFLERAIATNLAGYLLPYPELAEKYYPASVLTKIKSYQQRILLHSTLLREEILQLAPLLLEANIDFAVLKGWDLHFRYGASLKERQISDIDIYIEENNLKALEKLLQNEGFHTLSLVYKSKWQQKWLAQHAPLHAQKGALQVDIHTNAFAAAHQLNLPLSLKNRELLTVDGVQIPVLNETLAGQFLALHLSKHLEGVQPFKASQLIDLLGLKLSTSNLDTKEKKCIDDLDSFLKRSQALTFNKRHPYDAFYLQQLEGSPLPFKLKIRQLGRRMKPKNNIMKSLILGFFDVFPTKAYLQNLYGHSGYLVLWIKRTRAFFKF